MSVKRILAVVLIAVLLWCAPVYAGVKSDYDLAKAWADAHCKGAHIEKVVTKSQGGRKGKVCGARWTVKYPKSVAKGKKVTVYMVEKGGDIKAMVCLGKVK